MRVSRRSILVSAFVTLVAAGSLGVGAGPAGAITRPVSPVAVTVSGACRESFDALASSGSSSVLPPGATFDESGSSGAVNGSYAAGNGSSNAGDVYSLGATGSGERAFGQLRSGTLTPILGYLVANDTGAPLTKLGVTYTLEQWRQGGTNRFDRMLFEYSTTSNLVNTGAFVAVPALDATAPIGGPSGSVALDGNAAANRVTVSATITGLSVPPGGSILLRWSDVDALGPDDALGIDDLILEPEADATGGSFPACSGAVAPPPTGCPTTSPAPSLSGTVKIHAVNGNGDLSPIVGSTVTVEGVVTGVDDLVGSSFGSGNSINLFPRDRGFYLQEEAADADADPTTSEGIFVGLVAQTNPLPPIGALVRATGVVRDGQGAPSFGQTRIELPNVASMSVLSTGNPLPAPVVLDETAASTQLLTTDASPTRCYYERFEGMRVELDRGVARSGGTNKFGEAFLVPGGVGGTLLRTDPIERGLIATAADAGAGNPANPYLPPTPSTTTVEVDLGDEVRDLVGPLGYSFGNYKVVPQIGEMPVIIEQGVAFPYDRLAPPAPGQVRIASYNLENFFPVGGALDGGIVTPAEFASKRDRLADAIGRLLHAPDVVAVQEIGDDQHLGQNGTTTSLGTLQQLATRLGELGFGTYTAFALEGNDNRGIDVGFLVKSTVPVLAGPDQRGGLTAPGSCSDVAGRLFDRPPLFLQVDLGPIGTPWLVSNHWSSKAAPDSCRVAQADWLRAEVESLRLAGHEVIVLGDLNAFEDETPLARLQQGGTLANLWPMAPARERYSFQFNGLLQTLDHIAITAGVAGNVGGFQYAHVSNDYFDRGTDGHKASDHDPPVLTLVAPPPPIISEAARPWMLLVPAVAVIAAFAGLGWRRRLS
jgi:predicted extracellular nuclease